MDLFGRFRKLDSSLQRGLDNGLARVFGGEVVPTEIDELLKQQAEDSVMTDNYGQQLAPCYYTVLVSQDDHQSLIEHRPNLESDLADRLTRFIRNNGWATPSPVHVEIEAHRNLHSGQLRARSLFGEPDHRSSHSDANEADNNANHQIPNNLDGAPNEGDRTHAASQQGGLPDGSYPDSYPGQQLHSPAQWPQREANGQREVAAREYDAVSAGNNSNGVQPGTSTAHSAEFTEDRGCIDDASSDRIYEDTAFSEATYREPVEEHASGTGSAGFDGAAPNDPNNSGTNTHKGEYDHDSDVAGHSHNVSGSRGLADIVRSGSTNAHNAGPAIESSAQANASVASSAVSGTAGATAAAGAAGINHEAADSAADNQAMQRSQDSGPDSQGANDGWAGEQGGVGEENDPATGQQEAQQPSYPGTEIIAQSAPDAPVKGGEGYGDQESDVRVTLHLRDGSDRKYQLREGSNLIGRGNGVDLRIPDTGVSRQHADIVWDGYDAVLTDLHSTNGTTVNETPVENWLLADGDLIIVGHSEILVQFEQK